MKKLWGGRFKGALDQTAKKYSYSLAVDHELLGAEIRVSQAHVMMLAKVKIISQAEAAKIVRGLGRVLETLRKSSVSSFEAKYEDIHTLVQGMLEKQIGSLARSEERRVGKEW